VDYLIAIDLCPSVVVADDERSVVLAERRA
jgi:hypothetical protein